jgi:hypothetical protein
MEKSCPYEWSYSTAKKGFQTITMIIYTNSSVTPPPRFGSGAGMQEISSLKWVTDMRVESLPLRDLPGGSLRFYKATVNMEVSGASLGLKILSKDRTVADKSVSVETV